MLKPQRLERRWCRSKLPYQWVAAMPRERQPDSSIKPLNFSDAMRQICDDLARRVPELAHINTQAMLFSFTTSRNRSRYGLLARVTPLRLEQGSMVKLHRGRQYQIQRYFVGEQELLYLVTFCLPRFLDLPFEEKLITIVHELFHIHPQFNGDIRRHSGRYQYHTHSKKELDAGHAEIVRRYLAFHDQPELFQFLHQNFKQIWAANNGVFALHVPNPRLVLMPTPPAREPR